MATRKRGTRPLLIDSLKQIKRLSSALQNVWTVSSYFYVPIEGDPRGNTTRRPRRPHEYPENLLQMLEDAECRLEGIMIEANHARMLILDRIEELREGK